MTTKALIKDIQFYRFSLDEKVFLWNGLQETNDDVIWKDINCDGVPWMYKGELFTDDELEVLLIGLFTNCQLEVRAVKK